MINGWGAVGRHKTTIPLTTGFHDLRIEHRQGEGPASMVFTWALEGIIPEQPVPREALYHAR
jgi:hypothetical protein